MLDPKLIRETPDLVRAAIARKHLDVDLDAILALDAAWRSQLQEVESLRARQKAVNGEMAEGVAGVSGEGCRDEGVFGAGEGAGSGAQADRGKVAAGDADPAQPAARERAGRAHAGGKCRFRNAWRHQRGVGARASALGDPGLRSHVRFRS